MLWGWAQLFLTNPRTQLNTGVKEIQHLNLVGPTTDKSSIEKFLSRNLDQGSAIESAFRPADVQLKRKAKLPPSIQSVAIH